MLTMNNGHCIVFLKQSFRKTHFDSFSAVSAAPEACELANCAEFDSLPIFKLKTTACAQKMQLFGDPNRGSGPRATPPHTFYPLPPLNKKAEAEAEAEADCQRNRRARARQMHFLAQFFAL